jgi:hypothetical protein
MGKSRAWRRRSPWKETSSLWQSRSKPAGDVEVERITEALGSTE